MTIPQTFALAIQHHQAGRLGDAEALYRQILAVLPNHPQALHHLGVVAHQRGRHDLAVEWIRHAVVLNPDNHAAHSNLAQAYRALGRLDEAVASGLRALRLRPDLPEMHNNLGLTLAAQGQFSGAAGAYRQALELQPHYAEACNNLGGALAMQDQLEEAIVAFRRALELQPSNAEAQNNLGHALKDQGQFDEAMACYRRAVACRVDFGNAHWNLSILLLLLGRYEEGWHEYEWRWHSSAHARHLRHFSAPQWDGNPAIGKTILIHAEAGFGDTLQFLRYLPLVPAQSQAARVIFECQPALFSLLRQLQSPGIEIVARGASDELLPPFDLQLPLFSLPLVLRRFEPEPMIAPALYADAGLRTQWRERLGSGATLRVGLCWAGNPHHGNDRRRSIAPGKLLPLFSVPDIRFVSLQVGPRAPLPPALAAAGVLDFTVAIGSFADSAALMAELDLIITVDTATAHLAGTLGRPVWLLLPFVPDWRWGLKREDTPWYPTMRLFRQSQAGDWEEVLNRVATALRERPAL